MRSVLPPRPHRQSGYTLVEVMVVLIIVGLLSAGAVLGVERVTEQRRTSEAERLTAWLTAIRDQSIFTGGIYAIASSDTGLRAVYWVNSGWQNLSGQTFTLGPTWSIKFGEQSTSNPGLGAEPELIFLPGGTVANSGEINLRDEGEPFYTISWTSTGQISGSRFDG